MKKSLLLSIAASAVVFAGGDIAPVQPVQPTAAPAACDFWGTLAFRYDANKKASGADKFFKADDRGALAIVMGVEKELGYGFGFGAEVAGLMAFNNKLDKVGEAAEISQLYLTYKVGNTAIKAGRQALPKAVSPWAWSDRTAGILDTTFNGVTVVNTDIQNTTLVAAWLRSFNVGIAAVPGIGVFDIDSLGSVKIGDKGVFMLGALTKVSNVDLSFAGYYIPDLAPSVNAKSVWAAAETKLDSVDLGLQVAYAKIDGLKSTLGIAAYVGTTYNALDAKLTLAYINDGASPLNGVGALTGGLQGTSGFWGNSFAGAFGGETVSGNKQKIARIDLGYKIDGYGKVYGGIGVDKPDTGKTTVGGRIGYDFKVMDVNAKIEYRYIKNKGFVKDNDEHRIRVQGVYKF